MANSTETDVKQKEEFITNSRGMKLFTCRWVPEKEEAKALIFLCHGYAVECSVTMDSTGKRLAQAGFAVYGIDYEGHGKSHGLLGLVNNFDDVVNDCFSYFSSICEEEENKEKMRMLLGESMGGAVALRLHMKMPEYWDGAILVAPMCKIRSNPLCYKGWLRLKMGHELLKLSLETEKILREVSLPFLVLHGEEDKVTDISVSKQLHEVASSSNKTIKLYPGMWHALLYGETPENQNTVFKDIIDWVENRCQMR